jgi:hypothetical protein
MVQLDENKRKELSKLVGLKLAGFGPSIDVKEAAKGARRLSKAAKK